MVGNQIKLNMEDFNCVKMCSLIQGSERFLVEYLNYLNMLLFIFHQSSLNSDRIHLYVFNVIHISVREYFLCEQQK